MDLSAADATANAALQRRSRRESGGLTDRQRELLERLTALFLAEGFAHFTLDDLAVRLHCSKSTLYALAPSKEQLAVTAVRHYFRSAAAAVEATVEGVPDASARIGRYLAAIGDQMRVATAPFMADVSAFGPTHDIYDRTTRAAAERIRALVTEGIEAGQFRPVHTALVAEMIAATIGAIQRREIQRRTGLDNTEAFTQLSAIVLGALQTSATTGDSSG